MQVCANLVYQSWRRVLLGSLVPVPLFYVSCGSVPAFLWLETSSNCAAAWICVEGNRKRSGVVLVILSVKPYLCICDLSSCNYHMLLSICSTLAECAMKRCMMSVQDNMLLKLVASIEIVVRRLSRWTGWRYHFHEGIIFPHISGLRIEQILDGRHWKEIWTEVRHWVRARASKKMCRIGD